MVAMSVIQVGDKVKVENTNWVKKGKTYLVVSDEHPAVGVRDPKGGPVIYVDKAYCVRVK